MFPTKPKRLAAYAADVSPEWRRFWKDLRLLFAHDSGPEETDLAHREVATETAGTISLVHNTIWGTASDFDGSSILDLGNPEGVLFSNLDEWTTASVFSADSFSGDDGALWAKWAGGTNSRQYLLRMSSGAAPRPVQMFVKANERAATAAVIELNNPYLVFSSCDGSSDGGAPFSTIAIWVFDLATGELIATDTGIFTGGDASTNNRTVTIGARDGDFLDGQIGLSALWTRLLTTNEMFAMARDPWGPFRPQRQMTRFKPTAAAAFVRDVIMGPGLVPFPR